MTRSLRHHAHWIIAQYQTDCICSWRLTGPDQGEDGLQTPADAGLLVQREMIELLLSLLTEQQRRQFVERILAFPGLTGYSRSRFEELEQRLNARLNHAGPATPAAGQLSRATQPAVHSRDLGSPPALSEKLPPSHMSNVELPTVDQHRPDPHLDFTMLPSSSPNVNARIRNAATTPIDPVETKKHRQDNGQLSDNLDALLLESAAGLAGFAPSHQASRLAANLFERAASAPVVPADSSVAAESGMDDWWRRHEFSLNRSQFAAHTGGEPTQTIKRFSRDSGFCEARFTDKQLSPNDQGGAYVPGAVAGGAEGEGVVGDEGGEGAVVGLHAEGWREQLREAGLEVTRSHNLQLACLNSIAGADPSRMGHLRLSTLTRARAARSEPTPELLSVVERAENPLRPLMKQSESVLRV